jgi:hypothetical protein
VTTQITTGDIAAFCDVLDLMSEQSDSLSLEDASQLRLELEAVKAKIAETIGLLDTQMKKSMDGQAVQSTPTTTVRVVPNLKKRPDHGKIRRLIISRAMVDEDGSRLALMEDAVEAAVDITYQLFVAPSDKPKTTPLKDIFKLWPDDVSTEEKIGETIEVKRVDAE